jgi:hypothetical protein
MLTTFNLEPVKKSYHEKIDSINRDFIFISILSLLCPWHYNRAGGQWQSPLWQKLPSLIPVVNIPNKQKSKVYLNQ